MLFLALFLVLPVVFGGGKVANLVAMDMTGTTTDAPICIINDLTTVLVNPSHHAKDITVMAQLVLCSWPICDVFFVGGNGEFSQGVCQF